MWEKILTDISTELIHLSSARYTQVPVWLQIVLGGEADCSLKQNVKI